MASVARNELVEGRTVEQSTSHFTPKRPPPPATDRPPRYRTWRTPPRPQTLTPAPPTPPALPAARAPPTQLFTAPAQRTQPPRSVISGSHTAQPHQPPPLPAVRHGRRPGKVARTMAVCLCRASASCS
jgi:hypothetical protein